MSGADCGAWLITKERGRQIAEEGWDEEHDDEHDQGQLAWAAVCYAAPDHVYKEARFAVSKIDPWPWDDEWDKRPAVGCTTPYRVRALVKAGALIAAEIDRLLRVEVKA